MVNDITPKSGLSKVLVYFICYALYAPMLDYLFMFYPISGFARAAVIYGILTAVVFFSCLYCVYYHTSSTVFIFTVAYLALWMSTFANPELNTFIYKGSENLNGNPFYLYMFWGVPLIPMLGTEYDIDDLWKALCRVSTVVLVFGIVSYFSFTLRDQQNMDYIVFTYYIELPTFVCFFNGFFRNNRTYKILAVIGIIATLLSGGRGAFIQLTEFFFLVLYFTVRRQAVQNRVIGFALAVLLLGFIIIYYNQIIGFIESILKEFGINSRIYSTMIQSSFFDDNGRSVIAGNIWNNILKNPFGGGLWSDRYYSSIGLARSSYAHNLFLELMSDFGFIIGGGIIIYLTVSIFKIIINFKYDAMSYILVIGMLYITGKLMFSGTFVTDNMFYFFCGLLLKQRREMKKPKNASTELARNKSERVFSM